MGGRGASSRNTITGIINKKHFYEQLKSFNNPNIPISIYTDINKDYKIVLEEERTSREKFNGNFVMQIIDKNKNGYEKHIANDIRFNLQKEKISSDYQLYKWVNNKIKTIKIRKK